MDEMERLTKENAELKDLVISLTKTVQELKERLDIKEGKNGEIEYCTSQGEAALYLGINQRTVARLIKASKFPTPVLGKKFVWQKKDLQEWKEKNKWRYNRVPYKLRKMS